MFICIARRAGRLHKTHNTSGSQCNSVKRRFSHLSVHSTFPASLYRFQEERNSRLHQLQGTDCADAVEMAADGLVHPGFRGKLSLSNGAIMKPNTFSMQEFLRHFYDDYIDGLENGEPHLEPTVVRIQKGTVIPSTLTLFHEESSRFSLQPSQPVTIQELNDLLDTFYAKHATFTDAVEWMGLNEYTDCMDDDDVQRWMSQ